MSINKQTKCFDLLRDATGQERLDLLQAGINERQRELHRVADILANHACTQGRRAAYSKSAVIILGAFVATQAVAYKIFGEPNTAVLIVFTLAGLLIAALSGLDAAFKVETTASDLRSLAARCHSTIWEVDSDWHKEVATAEGPTQIEGARKLMERQDQVLTESITSAAKSRVNITLEIRSEYRAKDDGGDRNYPAMA
jgi:hypothetical protein